MALFDLHVTKIFSFSFPGTSVVLEEMNASPDHREAHENVEVQEGEAVMVTEGKGQISCHCLDCRYNRHLHLENMYR